MRILNLFSTSIVSYKITLPNDIPPSHRGKAIRFNYYLVVGTQRAPSIIKQPSLPTQGQVVQIRFRVLNHVSEDGSRPIYDLMNPIIQYKDEAIVDEFENRQIIKKKKSSQNIEERKAFMDYVDELFENSTKTRTVHEITRRESDVYEERNTDEQSSMEGSCSQVVSRITHRSRKGNYMDYVHLLGIYCLCNILLLL